MHKCILTIGLYQILFIIVVSRSAGFEDLLVLEEVIESM